MQFFPEFWRAKTTLMRFTLFDSSPRRPLSFPASPTEGIFATLTKRLCPSTSCSCFPRVSVSERRRKPRRGEDLRTSRWQHHHCRLFAPLLQSTAESSDGDWHRHWAPERQQGQPKLLKMLDSNCCTVLRVAVRGVEKTTTNGVLIRTGCATSRRLPCCFMHIPVAARDLVSLRRCK